MPGIGKTLEEKLRALDETGDIPALVKLRAKFPAGLIEVMHLPGFGPKRARKLFDELGIDSLDALRAAVEAGKIKELRGFGLKAEMQLKQTLAEQEAARRAGAACGALARGGRSPRRSSPRCARTRRATASRWRARCAAAPTRSRTSTSSPPRATRRRSRARSASSSSSSRCSPPARRARA